MRYVYRPLRSLAGEFRHARILTEDGQGGRAQVIIMNVITHDETNSVGKGEIEAHKERVAEFVIKVALCGTAGGLPAIYEVWRSRELRPHERRALVRFHFG